MTRTICTCLVLTALASNAIADTIAQWNFNSTPPDANVGTGTITPSTGVGTASLIGAATATFATGSTSDSAGAGDNSGWNTANYPAQGSNNKMAGIQFSVSTASR